MTPVLYSFRRCPYAMRARLAIASAGTKVELREVVLRNKPQTFLDTSPSGTVPCLRTGDGVIDESYEIMLWAVRQNDPEGLLDVAHEAQELIAETDGPFKQALDRTKYETRYPECDPSAERANAMTFLAKLDTRLQNQSWLFGDTPKLADLAILPFVRQFAHIDKARFGEDAGPNLRRWLNVFIESERFAAVMTRYPQWRADDTPIFFGARDVLCSDS